MRIKTLIVSALLLSFAAPQVQASSYDLDYVGDMEMYRAEYEDTLVHLARWNNLGFVEMIAANPTLDPWIPGAGARVVLPKRHLLPEAPRNGIVINLPEMHLFYFPKDGSEPEVYSIGIGRDGLNTPEGETTIVRKKEGPTWRPTQRMKDEDPTLKDVYPPGPDNPLGTHAMYLGWPQYAIHGTNKPYGIGRRISSGCIRMYPESITELFKKISVGTRVTVVDQPVKVGWIDDKMYIEVHPTQDQSIDVDTLEDIAAYDITADDMKLILEKAGAYTEQIDWENVREAMQERSGYPVAVLDKDRSPGSRVRDDFKALLQDAKVEASEVYTVVKPENMPESIPEIEIEEEEVAKNEVESEDKDDDLNLDVKVNSRPAYAPRSEQSWRND